VHTLISDSRKRVRRNLSGEEAGTGAAETESEGEDEAEEANLEAAVRADAGAGD